MLQRIFRLIYSSITFLLQAAFSFYQEKPRLISSKDVAIKILNADLSNFSRSKPNSKLGDTFGLSNSFFNDNPLFRRQWRQLITARLAEFSRKDFSFQAAQFLRELTASCPADRLELMTVVQVLSLKSFCGIVLDHDPFRSDFESAVLVAGHINKLWALSKSSNCTSGSSLLKELIFHLSELNSSVETENNPCVQSTSSTTTKFHGMSSFCRKSAKIISQYQALNSSPQMDPKHAGNPLNLLIPGYETMWRVVFYAILEVLRCGHSCQHSNTAWMQDVARDSDLVQAYVLETLRVYPPTRKIYRQDVCRDQLVAVDVAQLNCQEEVWGLQATSYPANQFHAERWLKDGRFCDSMTAALFSFGSGNSLCPAAKMFARKFSCTLVKLLLDNEYLQVRFSNSRGVDPYCLSRELLFENRREGYNGVWIDIIKR